MAEQVVIYMRINVVQLQKVSAKINKPMYVENDKASFEEIQVSEENYEMPISVFISR